VGPRAPLFCGDEKLVASVITEWCSGKDVELKSCPNWMYCTIVCLERLRTTIGNCCFYSNSYTYIHIKTLIHINI
jgi:hypothetical protein